MALQRLGLLILAILIATNAHPGHKHHKAAEEWWKTEAIYQIYPLSLKDDDNNGRGDLKGIIGKLPYLKETGIGGVWISPIYPSPMVDFGYDISDFVGINDWYGTMDDFDQLVQTAHDLGLKLIMDFVPNHSSDQHEWFKKSANNEPGYEDYYVWRDPKGFDNDGNPIPPNNWVSVFRGSAWTYNDQRKQFYLHQFASAQPDLNYRNPKVVEEMKNVIRFWVKKGVDGFRIDAVPFIFETENFEDEPVHVPPFTDDTGDYGYLDHPYTVNQPGTYDMIQQWRELIDQENAQDGGERCLMVEVYASIEDTMRYYGTPERPGAHFPFNFQIINTNDQSDAQELKRNIDIWFDNLPEGAHSTWVIGNHDQGRVGSKVGSDIIDGMNMLVTLLPGTSVTYYGEEIGMLNNDAITYEQGVDPQGCNYPPEQFHSRSRDFQRTPFQWDNTTNAGFNTGAETWLPVHDNYKELNLEAQKGQPYSHYTIYTDLMKIRQEPAIRSGRLNLQIVGKGTLGLLRYTSSDDFIVILINFSHEADQIDLDSVYLLGDRQLNVYTTNAESGLEKNSQISSTNITLAPRSSVVLTIPSSS